MSKDINADIKYIKDIYGIDYDEARRPEVFDEHNTLSYDENMDGLNGKTLGHSEFDLEVDDIKLSKIVDIACEVLTDKQYIYFDLYFFQGLRQQEIAELTGDNQSTISRNINSIIEKLKKSLLEN